MTSKRQLASDGEVGSPPEESFSKLHRPMAQDVSEGVDDHPNLPFPLGQGLRSSARVLRQKEERKESEGTSEEIQEVPDVEDISPAETVINVENQRPKRAWEQWSDEDQNLFFVALNDCGKNFDAMELFFQARTKRGRGSNLNAYKHKEQIRTFYYRTWHKLSKYIRFPETLKKSTRELYTLINYGELRKKIGNSFDKIKNGKLQELVDKGSTAIKCKGKVIRIRTPACPALKRHAGVTKKSQPNEETLGSSSVPKKVTIELLPLNVQDFHRANRLAFSNPRISIKLSLQRRLSAILDRLEKKFNSVSDKTWLYSIGILKQAPKHNSDDFELWIVPREGTVLKSLALVPKEQGPPNSRCLMSLSKLQSKMETQMVTTNDDLFNELKHSIDTEAQPANEKEFRTTENIKDEESPQLDFFSNGISVKEENFEDGWNFDKALQISVGELYLMSGCNSNILRLNYTWKKKASGNDDDEGGSVLLALANLANSELARKQSSKVVPITVCSPMQMKPGQNPMSQSPSASRLSDRDIPPSTISPKALTLNCVGSEQEFRRPAVPTNKSYQFNRIKSEIILPKYTLRKGRRPMSRTRTALLCQLNAAANWPLQPKRPQEIICRETGSIKTLLPPNGQATRLIFTIPSQVSVPLNNSDATQILPSSTVLTVPMTNESMLNSRIHSADHIQNDNLHDDDNNTNTDSFSISLSLFDENSRSDLDLGSSNTHSIMHVDRFLDTCLENSNSSLLQTPRRQSTPSSPPGGMSENSWLPDLSFLGSLPGDGLTESPSKMSLMHHDDSMHSTGSEVDRHVTLMLTESSVDFTAKFEKLASAITDCS